MNAIDDGFACPDRTSPSDANDEVCYGTFYSVDSSVNSSYRSMFADFPECVTVRIVRSEYLFYFVDNVGLCWR